MEFLNILIYILGAMIEIFGFALLFNKEGFTKWLKKNFIWISIALIIMGWLIAVNIWWIK